MDALENTRKRRMSPIPLSPRKRKILDGNKSDEPSSLYQPLGKSRREIRLISLLSGQDEEPIKCTLGSHFLDDYPDYEALSYAWGDRNVTAPIKVNDKPFQVTINLFTALKRLRKPQQDRRLWIDAICIDQSNTTERTHQVSLMGDIYRSCQNVIIWLGEVQHSPAIDNLWMLLAKLSDYNCIREVGSWVSSAMEALSKMMNVKWWKRMWVVQELVLAPVSTFYYGGMSISYDALYRAAKFYHQHYYTASSGNLCRCAQGDQQYIANRHWNHLTQLSAEVLELNRFRERQRDIYDSYHSNPPDIVDLAISMRDRKCLDLRDKIYALLSMTATRQFITIDYSQTVVEAYIRCTVEMIKVDHSLRLLILGCTYHSGVVQDLPTWAPDWASMWLGEERAFLTRAIAFSADGGGKIAISPIGKTLRVMGVEAGIVQRVSMSRRFQDLYTFVTGSRFSLADLLYRYRHIDPPDGYDKPESGGHPLASQYLYATRLIRNLGVSAQKFIRRTIYASPDELLLFKLEDELFKMDEGEVALFRTLLNDVLYTARDEEKRTNSRRTICNAGEWEIRRKLSYEELCLARLYILLRLEAPDISVDSIKAFTDIKRTFDILRLFPNSEKTLFVTENGRIGLGPPNMQPGDQIFILQGAGIPFVLRPISLKFSLDVGEMQCHHLVGGCYVDGIMDGELFRDTYSPPWRTLSLY